MSYRSSLQAKGTALFLVAMALVLCLLGMAPAARAAGDPAQGPGGPILVITSGSPTFGTYYAEILRTEGLNAFAVADIATVTPASLATHDVVLLSKMALSASQASMLSVWVNGGGNLIAMAPDAQLASLLGIVPSGAASIANGYLRVDTSRAPGNGIVGETIQFHGAADLYNLSGATKLATLYSSAATATTYPAVTLNTAGSGRAAAFAYDLAASIVYTRQGNPAWATQERDGISPIRPDDKFYGNKQFDVQPDWVDLNKVAIPQADEQQRLLANLIVQMNLSRKPLPRFWYFPHGKKAVVIMSGDDHANGGTAGRFEQFKSASPAGCSVADWECVRGTSYIYPNAPLTPAQAVQYHNEGFEISLHINTGCADFTPSSLEDTYSLQLGTWTGKYSGIPSPVTQRHHCIVWSDWTTGAEVQFNHGMRLDTGYYYWPPGWVNNVPGLFTGSAMPMRYARLDGSFVDVFQVVTQMTDESGQVFPFTIDTLLDRALGAEGHFGVYTVNAHTDAVSSTQADAVVASALARGVPVVTSRQMLNWLDARNDSRFDTFTWNGSVLGFNLTPGSGANGLQAMLPARSGNAILSSLSRNGNGVAFNVQAIKGVDYAFFAGTGGTYQATYAVDSSPPTAPTTTPANGATGVSFAVKPSVTFGEAMDASTLTPGTFELREPGGALVTASVGYDAATRTATLVPNVALTALTTYTATLRGGTLDPRAKDAAGNALADSLTWSFTTGDGVPPSSCPCGAWTDSSVPTNPSQNDPNSIEVGVKFRTDVNGSITGIRFYKGGLNNGGTHIGNLWTVGGQLLATATFTAETASGWQQVNFASPVAIEANTVYVASYFAPQGNYAGDNFYFTSGGVDTPPVHLLQNGVSGANGVYKYSASSAFPTDDFRASNYWVDVVFNPGGPADTTPPTVSTTSPLAGATGVQPASAVSVTFSEPIDPATLTSSTFGLSGPGNAPVGGTLSYNAATRTASFQPSSLLAASTQYTATVKGGASGVKDVAGNPLAADLSWTFTTGVLSGTCLSPANAIVAENCLPGNPASEWNVSGAGDSSIQGFATDISVNRGSTVFFKVDSNASAYRFDIYRMGYYGGMGARKVATVMPSVTLPQSQPGCQGVGASGLIDCGNWAVSGSWAVPANAVSGIYFARLVRTDTQGASHIFFIVRHDGSTSDLLFQTSDTTWQAYNSYGGNSLYTGAPVGRAYKVSYNRPFNTRIVDGGADWVFNAEYPMVRWLESNGYDVSYFTGVDADRDGAQILNHKTFLSVGHDEYWSAGQRLNVEAARANGIHLAFFSGNEVFWKTRWENSIAGPTTSHRTLVSYKETHANAKIDPAGPTVWTGTWRDPRFGPHDGGRPENALTGTIFVVNGGGAGSTESIKVPEADGKMRFWRNTTVATQTPGATATLPFGTLGYEWDIDADNGFRPPGLARLSRTTVANAPVLTDFGSNYTNGTATHSLTLYKHNSGALVFGAGTIQWSWGLDANHDRGSNPADLRMQQATVNLLADMNAQPGTLRPGLVAATASTDGVAPTSGIVSPAAGAQVPAGTAVTVSGTASDTGGGVVGGVEVSVDGGATWHPANGRGAWSYSWTPSTLGAVTLRTRAVDDSGNLEAPGAGVAVTVTSAAPQTCPCTIWPSSTVPTVEGVTNDNGSLNIGVKFRADQDGTITGIRFYKGLNNTGTHIGTLWTSGGAPMASATFTVETASGWQQVNFATPVAVTANTVYVASYLAPNGNYAFDNGYFSATGVDNAPLHALKSESGDGNGNGVYKYGSTTLFPNETFGASNYWVDVVFVPTAPADTTPPTVASTTPTNGATGVSQTAPVTVTFSEALAPATVNAGTFELRGAGNALVAASVTYNTATFVATLTPSAPLAGTTAHTATVNTGITDAAGNPLAASTSWTFTTGSADLTPPTVTTLTPLNGATNVAAWTNVTAKFNEALDAATVNANTFELRDAANALVPATVSYVASSRLAKLDPTANLVLGAMYTATLKGGATDPRVKDVAGNPLAVDRTWSFSVVGDASAPTATPVTPVGGATAVAVWTNVTAKFSEALDPSTVNATTFELRDASSGALVPASVSYDTATRVAKLDPSANLALGKNYTATLKGGATEPRVKDLAGNPMAANLTWSFTTAGDTVAPTVVARVPASGAVGVVPTSNMTAKFSEAIDVGTVNSGTFELRDASSVLVPAVVTYDAATLTAKLNPVPTLGAGAGYSVTVRGGATDPRVKDVAGNALAGDVTWTFTTLADTTAPTVAPLAPSAGATGFGKGANVTVKFNEAMDPATITTATFELRDPSDAVVPAVVTYDAATRVARLNPNATLLAGTVYTVVVKGSPADPSARDLAGNPLAGTATWSFTTQ